jgi:hypothetical protein
MALNPPRGAGSGSPDGPVLIGFADALAAPEAADSLLRAGLSVAAFQRRGGRSPLRRRRELALHGITAPEHDAAATVGELAELAARLGAAALMPLDDASVWLCDRAAARTGMRVVGPTGKQAELALNKALQIDAASQAGLAVPPTHVVSTDAAPRVNNYPVMVKPALAVSEAEGRLTRGAPRLCADAAELRETLRGRERLGTLLVQPRLRGTGEGLFGIAVDGRIVSPSAHRRLRMLNPQGSGSSACVSAALDPQLAAAGARLLTDAGWRGLFMLEFLRDSGGTAWFMELNGRSWGSLALARRLGLEYPAWAALETLGVDTLPVAPGPPSDSAPVVCRHLAREILHVGAVVRGPRPGTGGDWPSRWRTVLDVARIRRGERWYNWSPDHPSVFITDTVDTLLDAVRRGDR